MDPVKAFKGYGKVEDQSDVENQTASRSNFNQKQKKPFKITAAIIGILLLSLTVGLFIQALSHESSSEEELEHRESPSSLASIKAVCNFTRFPDSCFASIASAPLEIKFNTVNCSDPVAIFKLSLLASINELSKLSAFLKTQASNSNGADAVRDCVSQNQDSLNQLNDSVSVLLDVGPAGKGFTDKKINDIQTWISAALTYEDTCLDGLEESGSSVFGAVKSKMQKSKEYISNSLAIVANMNTILNMFHMSKN